MSFDKSFIDNTIYFDSLFYKNTYLDVKKLALDASVHFMKYGSKMNRIASPGFLSGEDYFKFLEYKFSELQQAKKLKLSVEQLTRKLKSGFQSISILLLIEVVEDKEYRTKKERSRASWELARTFATISRWDKVEYYLNKARYLDASFMRKKRPRLLEIEALARVGDFSKAFDRIDHVLSKEIDGDFLCAKSNVSYYKMGINADNERINDINSIYRSLGMSTLEKIDAGKTFSFLNIISKGKYRLDKEEKISILLPVYNAENFLQLSVGSLLQQTYKNIEIIAVDDKSTDNSYEVLLKLADTDNRLKVFKNESNSGAYPTRNRALRLATGDIITVHDSDDWSHPQMLEKQYEELKNYNTKITFSFMVRVSENLEFSLRPERNNMEYIHRSYPSLMIRRKDLNTLGEWDAITANADDEFVQRARIIFGDESVKDVLPQVPMSFFLKHSASLTSDPKTSLKSLDYGVRKEYALQARFWRENLSGQSAYAIKRTSNKAPFPIPNGLNPDRKKKLNSYDLILISDLTLLGGTRRCNQAYIEAAQDLGLRVGIFHWPRFDLKVVDDIAPEYRFLSRHDKVDILTWEEELESKSVIIHHPPILKYEPDDIPKIKTRNLYILVNQSPKQLHSQEPHYYFQNDVNKLCLRNFNVFPQWIAISPTAKEVLKNCEFNSIIEDIWYPPLSESFFKSNTESSKFKQTRDYPVVGRHARDHWTKWPSDIASLRSSYLVDSKNKVELLGGASVAIKKIGYKPSNWSVHEFDSISVYTFLEGIDFFVHFPHEDYIEEFGRNIAEAMALGVPVILPVSFKECFGDSAIYCNYSDVQKTVNSIWKDQRHYNHLVNKGKEFVLSNLSIENTQNHINSIIS